MKKLFLTAFALTTLTTSILCSEDIPVQWLDKKKPKTETNINPLSISSCPLHHALFRIITHPSSYFNEEEKSQHFLPIMSRVDKSLNAYIYHPNIICHIFSYIAGDRHQKESLFLINYIHNQNIMIKKVVEESAKTLLLQQKKEPKKRVLAISSKPTKAKEAEEKKLLAKFEADLNECDAKNISQSTQYTLEEAFKSGDGNCIIKTIEREKITLEEALKTAISMQQINAVSILLDLGADPTPHLEKPIQNDIILCLLCSALEQTNTTLNDGTPPRYKSLHSVFESVYNAESILAVLQNENLSLSEALEYAIFLQKDNAVLALLRLGADPAPHIAKLKNNENEHIRAALFSDFLEGQTNTFFIEKSCTIAMDQKDTKKIKWLLENGANLNDHLYNLVTKIVTDISDERLDYLTADLNIVNLLCAHGAYHPDASEIAESGNHIPKELLQFLRNGCTQHQISKQKLIPKSNPNKTQQLL